MADLEPRNFLQPCLLLLLAAYDQARADGFVGTDTASCVQRYTDLPVRWVPGDERNLKITYPHDLARAQRLVSFVTR